MIVIKSDDFFIAIRAVPDYGKMRMGHVHNDILHYELLLDNIEWFADQGSYVYTGHKEWRNRFRSDEFHNVPVYQDKWVKAEAMFSNAVEVTGECFAYNNTIFTTAICGNTFHVRCFQLHNDKLIVKDFSNRKFELSKMTNIIVRSSGYGIRTKERV